MNLANLLLNSRSAKVYGLVSAMLVMWLGGFFDKEGQVVKEYRIQGVIVEIHERAYLVRLSDGRQVRLAREQELVKGTQVSLKIMRYDTKKERAILLSKS